MLFNSIPFILFFPIVVIVYYLIPQKIRYVWLLVCSYFFYLSQSTAFVTLLVLSTITTYIAGDLLYRIQSRVYKNLVVAITFTVNVGIWFFIKYADFVLDACGSDRRFNLFLPIGISFYTLQALSYVMDCYRKNVEPMHNLIRYALYVSFFPSLLSGPINKASDFMPELSCNRDFDLDEIKVGMQKMLWGYFLKLVIAARLTILVDTAYANIDGFSGSSLLIAAIAFLFMLYCDFEGYSCIAIGAAYILGISMNDNFRQPFYSTSINELWSRWHISLSTWFKEYLYFSLGGSRKGKARKYLNILIVFFVSGLWHGANYTFFIWGLLNGFFRIMGEALKPIRDQIANRVGLSKHTNIRNILLRIGVYCLYGFTMIFFSLDSVSDALNVIKRIFLNFNAVALVRGEAFSLGLGMFNLAFVILMSVVVLVVDGYCNKKACDVTGMIKVMPTLARWGMYLGIITLILFSANLTGQEFIYAQM